jgi:hypothetical protein
MSRAIEENVLGTLCFRSIMSLKTTKATVAAVALGNIEVTERAFGQP